MENGVRIQYGTGTVRKTVTIAKKQAQELRRLCDESGLSESEVIRLALIRLFRDPVIFLTPLHNESKRCD